MNKISTHYTRYCQKVALTPASIAHNVCPLYVLVLILLRFLLPIPRMFKHLFVLLWLGLGTSNTQAGSSLFGYPAALQSNLQLFPQWLSVLERHLKNNIPEGHCQSRRLDSCHVKNWHSFLQRIKKLPKAEQIEQVNLFANQQNYILDIDNYKLEDYWATPKEFLYNSGDCEDYAITKMLSLKQLGFNTAAMRIVVLQDTNLRIPHAVLAINIKGDILILDNQIDEVISHKHIVHYTPIYALNEQYWWMFSPK